MDPQIPHYVTLIPVGYSVLGPPTDYFGLGEEVQEFGQEQEDEEEDNGGQLFGNNNSNNINGVVNFDGPLSNNGTVPFKGNNGEYRELNRGEVDGLFCPICFDGWYSGGDHHVCCLPCGHIYGLSCIKKWLERPGSSKCPQCKKACQINDIRLLYATRVVAIDGELQKKVKSLEAKCASLEKQGVELSTKEAVWKKKEEDFCKKIQFLTNIQQLAKQSLAVFQAEMQKVQSLEAKCASLEKQALRRKQYGKVLTNIQQHAKQSLTVFQAEMQKRMQAQIDEHTYLMQRANTFMFPPPPPPDPTNMFPPPPPTLMVPPPPPPALLLCFLHHRPPALLI
ncbi:hypothetical protein CASFOL_027516 [Castilleja foliolosa]|uniref:RING-type domain-containing protein n=1 Tax=Castilleja foliolosa TaxID=1961234 RepID=A0ABD3CF16_9LAMI